MSLLARIIEKGLVASGRMARIRVVIPDQPGFLHRYGGDWDFLGFDFLTFLSYYLYVFTFSF